MSVRVNEAWPIANQRAGRDGADDGGLSTSPDRAEILERPTADMGPGEMPGPALEGSEQVSSAIVALSPEARKQCFQPKFRC